MCKEKFNKLDLLGEKFLKGKPENGIYVAILYSN
jgi:hypothetical protein